ncbi:MAG: Ig-like domain-containing protein, partial [Proteobacteria bacterium]|nr:Ig-like domain-containing protein [Pseudomonadota bacterium]
SRLAWESINNTIARFIEDGLLQAESVGDTRLNVIDNDQGIIKTRITTVRVTDAKKVAVVTVPDGGLPGDSVQLPKGRIVQYSAYSVFTDGSIIDTTSLTTFKSSDISIARPSGANGGFVGNAVGTVTITALDRASGLEAEPAELEVTSAVLESMVITPNIVNSISPGENIQFAVYGRFSDQSTSDLTKTASWSSDNSSAASVSNFEGNKGLVTGKSAGTANITAAGDENVNASVSVTVVN